MRSIINRPLIDIKSRSHSHIHVHYVAPFEPLFEKLGWMSIDTKNQMSSYNIFLFLNVKRIMRSNTCTCVKEILTHSEMLLVKIYKTQSQKLNFFKKTFKYSVSGPKLWN
jgi:hypothetical protein